MRFVVAALVLLVIQQLWWREPAAMPSTPPAVEALLGGRNSTPVPVALRGRVVDASPTWGEGVRLTLAVESADDAPADGLVSVSLRETGRRWRTGDRLALRSRLRRIAGFGNFGELDWAAYNARRGIFTGAYAWKDADVEALPRADGVVDGMRRRFSEACEAVGGQGAEILEALLIGDRTGIDRDTSIAVRDAGLAHFLAISGSHMALVVVLVVWLVRRAAGLSPWLLERYDVMRPAALAAGLAVVGYGALTGGGVSVARSELMAVAAMVALWRGRPGDDWRALGGSAVVLALAMPGVGEEAGFQLSYLAVAALILDSRRRRVAAREAALLARAGARRAGAAPETAPSWLRRGLEALLEAARLTLVCWAVTSPVVAFHFQRISLVAPLANLLAAPLVSAIVVAGLAGLLLLPAWPWAGHLAVVVGSFLSGLVVRVSFWCAALPHAAAATAAPGAQLAASLTGLALSAIAPPGPWRRAARAALAAASVGLVVLGVRERWRTDRLDVWFASVGQGDAAIVKLPGGRVWVVDEGPPGRGRMVVGPLLRRAWIGRVDVLVASHVQSDHAGALGEILEDFEVGEVRLPDGPCDAPAARAILSDAHRRGVPVRFVSRDGEDAARDGEAAARDGEASAKDAATAAGAAAPARASSREDGVGPEASGAAGIEVLWPPRGAARCNDNDQSQVLSFSFAGRRVLFTGDIEAAAETGAMSVADVHADVLKVAHHGSRTSSTSAFLDAVRPSLAVASLGVDNQFHFPAPEVVARFASRGIRLLRTDRDGAIHLTIDADGGIDVETFRAPGAEPRRLPSGGLPRRDPPGAGREDGAVAPRGGQAGGRRSAARIVTPGSAGRGKGVASS